MASGSEYTVFDTPHGCRVGLLICYDCNINENVRLTTLMGAEILLAPHQTGGCDGLDENIMGLVEKLKNLKLNKIKGIVRRGAIFEPWKDEKFDYIVCDIAAIAKKISDFWGHFGVYKYYKLDKLNILLSFISFL